MKSENACHVTLTISIIILITVFFFGNTLISSKMEMSLALELLPGPQHILRMELASQPGPGFTRPHSPCPSPSLLPGSLLGP